jgi:choline transport protein
MDQQQMDRGDEKGTGPLFEGRGGTILSVVEGEEVNASGHRDQLQRQYSIWSICGLALTIDNAWVALGGSIVVAVGMMPIISDISLILTCLLCYS